MYILTKLNPNFSEAYNNLGNVQKKINLVDDAIKNYKKAISADKNNITAYFNLAVLFKELRKYPESKSRTSSKSKGSTVSIS